MKRILAYALGVVVSCQLLSLCFVFPVRAEADAEITSGGLPWNPRNSREYKDMVLPKSSGCGNSSFSSSSSSSDGGGVTMITCPGGGVAERYQDCPVIIEP